MKNNLFIIIVLFVSTLQVAYSQDTDLGVNALGNFNLNKVENSSGIEFQNHKTLGGGVYVDIHLSSYLELQFIPMIVRTKYSIDSDEFKYDFMELPLLLKLNFVNANKNENIFFFSFGISGGVRLNSWFKKGNHRINLTDNIQDLAYSIVGGIGYEHKYRGWSLIIQPNLFYGLTNLIDSNINQLANNDLQNVAIRLNIGVIFPYCR